jgi:Flp pilus assembly protein TadD
MFTNKSHEEAHNLLKDGNINEAIELYTQALAENPDDCNILSDRAVAYLHKNDKLRCFGDFNRALELQPDYSYRYASRAYAKKHFGDLDGAVEDYEKAVLLDPDDAIAHNNLGMLLEEKGYKKQAEERFERADTLSKQENELLEVMDGLETSETVDAVALEEVTPTTRPLNEVTDTDAENSKSGKKEFKKVFTSKSQFREFLNFIKNGFKIK